MGETHSWLAAAACLLDERFLGGPPSGCRLRNHHVLPALALRLEVTVTTPVVIVRGVLAIRRYVPPLVGARRV